MKYFYGKHKIDGSFGFTATEDNQTDEVHSEFVEISESEYNGLFEKQKQGFEIKEKDGRPVVEKYEPTVEEQNELIRQTRESLYRLTSDYLKADYDEAVARGSENVEELKQVWLESKDKIRSENPYLEETDNVAPNQEI